MDVLSILKLVFLGVNTAVVAPIVVAVAAVDERRAYQVCQVWSRLNVLVSGARLRMRRTVPLDPHGAYVFMSNHRSHFDVLAVIEALPEFQLRWVAKKELTTVPVFGWALRHAGHVIIDRSDTEQAVRSLRAARGKMERGVSVVIFPEGTRAPAGRALLPLKKGGFMLALETGFPIVPIAVRGSSPVLPKGSWHVHAGDVDVVVGAPIPVVGRTREDVMRQVESFLLAHVAAPASTELHREAV